VTGRGRVAGHLEPAPYEIDGEGKFSSERRHSVPARTRDDWNAHHETIFADRFARALIFGVGGSALP